MSTNSAFQTWEIEQLEQRAAAYRAALTEVLTIARTYTGMIGWGAIDIYKECLAEKKVPPMPKYDGQVSQEDKAWYMSCKKPDFAAMLQDAYKQAEALKK